MLESLEPDEDPRPTDVADSLRQIRPLMRDVVERFDASLLDAFDAVYDDGAADAVHAILRPEPIGDELAGEQALGLRRSLATNVVAFLVNVAATLAVERFHNDLPDIWGRIVDSSPPAVVDSVDPVDRLLWRSRLSKHDRERLGRAIRQDPKLMRILNSSKHP